VSFLLDTNVISELAKRNPNIKVLAWLDFAPSTDLLLSVITLGEIRKGIERKRSVAAADAERLDTWLSTLLLRYRSRILPFDEECADRWGRIWLCTRQFPLRMDSSRRLRCATTSPW
jgi:toxin FitB